MEKDQREVMPVTIELIAIVVLIVAGILYFFTPFGFLGLSLDGEYQMKLTVGEHEVIATMENNTSAQALRQILNHRPVTIQMRDCEGMEKVGMLGRFLPSNNQSISTQPGDLILFMGGSFVIYYDTSHWNFTRLGHINNMSQAELMHILGDGNVTVTLSLE
jgi:hypothetical protein